MMLKKSTIIGLVSAALIILISGALFYFKFFDARIFYFIIGIAVIVAGLPFFSNLILEARREKSIDQMFLEFARDLVEGVKAGTPISKCVINVRNKDYESLNPHVNKLANQIALGIPVKDALETFARDVNSSVISRAVNLIREAEVSGGRIETILESVAFSVSQIEKLKKERKAAIYNLAVQGYIIFFIFIAIMLVMEFKILPIVSDIGGSELNEGLSQVGVMTFQNSGTATKLSAEDFSKPFLFLLLAQGFFVGLVIGKISEGSARAGLKHSFIMVALAWLISSGANIIFLK